MAHLDLDAIPTWGLWGNVRHTLERLDADVPTSITDYGADPSASGTVNTAAVQDALDAEAVVVVPSGTYNLDAAGPNPYDAGHQYCVEIGSNTRLVLLPGAVLQLADGQQTDAAGPVDIIIASAVSNVTITGQGTISGNTAGQTGWTGGYGQGDSNGNHIRIVGEAEDIEISGLTLRDHWASSLLVHGGASRAQRVRVQGIDVFDCGEGILLASVDHSWVDNCLVSDEAEVFVGDGIEWSDCDFFSSAGCRLIGPGAGSGFDVYNSRHGVISGFIMENWNTGASIDDGPGSVSDVLVENGTAYKSTGKVGNAFLVGGTDVTFQAVHAEGYAYGFQVRDGSPGPYQVEDCIAIDNTVGLQINTVAGLSIRGGTYSNNTNYGILYDGMRDAAADSDTERLFISGVTAAGNGVGILVSNSGGETLHAPTGGIINNMLLGNTTANYTAQGVAADDLTVSGNIT